MKITLENCNVEVLDYARTDKQESQGVSCELTSIEKIYYMARKRPVQLLEGEDGVWRPWRKHGGSFFEFLREHMREELRKAEFGFKSNLY